MRQRSGDRRRSRIPTARWPWGLFPKAVRPQGSQRMVGLGIKLQRRDNDRRMTAPALASWAPIGPLWPGAEPAHKKMLKLNPPLLGRSNLQCRRAALRAHSRPRLPPSPRSPETERESFFLLRASASSGLSLSLGGECVCVGVCGWSVRQSRPGLWEAQYKHQKRQLRERQKIRERVHTADVKSHVPKLTVRLSSSLYLIKTQF